MRINNISSVNAQEKFPVNKNNSFKALFEIKPYKDKTNPLTLLGDIYRKHKGIPDSYKYKDLQLFVSGMLAPLRPHDSKVVLNIYDKAGTAEIVCYPPDDETILHAYCAKVGNVNSQNIATNIYKTAKPMLENIYKKFCM